MKFKILLPCVVFLLAFSCPQKRKTTVWLAGDSTMSQKEERVFPEMGWGMSFSQFLDTTIHIENRAKNGRSTRTFLSEGLWQPIADNLHPGDYVFIQFGHNDESKQKVERYTSPADYRANLKKMVDDTRRKKAIPVLVTPVARRRFDEAGKVIPSHPEYSPVVRELAEAEKVFLIDLDQRSQELLQEMGKEASKYLFLQMEPGEHPNYPDGKMDNTHFNELGARKMASLVVAEMKAIHLPLIVHLRKSPKK